jgi:hypothetical protein
MEASRSARSSKIQQADFRASPEPRERLKPLIQQYVALGIHPTDPAGVAKFKTRDTANLTKLYDWNELFALKNGEWDWRDDDLEIDRLNQARREIVERMQKLVVEVLFQRTYFSIEECAFAKLRDSRAVAPWPADGMSPQDIHGEFLPTHVYFDDPSWRPVLERALEETKPDAEAFIAFLCEDSPNRAAAYDRCTLTPGKILQEIEELSGMREYRQVGLAHALAEQGKLPMYGMPTRVRSLLTGHQKSPTRPSDREWNSISRDLDLAIFEFAAGTSITKDKREYRCVGYTGALPNFRFGQRPDPTRPGRDPMGPAFSAPWWMGECDKCNSWYRMSAKDEIVNCENCGGTIGLSNECREPQGFRTDFDLDRETQNRPLGGKHQAIQVEGERLELSHRGNNMLLEHKSGIKTYRINRGARSPTDRTVRLGLVSRLSKELRLSEVPSEA